MENCNVDYYCQHGRGSRCAANFAVFPNSTVASILPGAINAASQTSTVQQSESDLSAPIIQSLLDQIQSLEQQLKRNLVSNTERSHSCQRIQRCLQTLTFTACALMRMLIAD
ncbi:unnamed protein product [Ceratitis capitata]|uniref:(Mediterranean fruit fly) hypothetical protein n=1 Tax=Ceratitis capitata TaxID=7213 RepID=A0A811UQR5_CERCA|nr:unnamed protein product [Ceratitis capitata]